MKLDLNKIKQEIINMEHNLLKAYYNVANLIIKGEDHGLIYEEAIDKLKSSHYNEQLYFLTLANDDITFLEQLSHEFDDANETGKPINSDEIVIYDRVYNQLIRKIGFQEVESIIRGLLPLNKEIEPSNLIEYLYDDPITFEYYALLYFGQASIYCSLEEIAAIYELTKNAEVENLQPLIHEMFKIAFSNSLLIDDFLERLPEKKFTSIEEKDIEMDCDIIGGEIFSLKEAICETMFNEATYLIFLYNNTETPLEKQMISAQIKQVLQYLDYEALENIKENLKELDEVILSNLESELSLRSNGISGKGECFDDYIVATESQGKNISKLVEASVELLKLYYEAAYYEIMSQKESDQYISLMMKISLTQDRERLLLQDLMDDDELYIILEDTLATDQFKRYFQEVLENQGRGNLDPVNDCVIVRERLENLFEQNEMDFATDEVDVSDENINFYLENGFDLDQPLSLFIICNQVMNIAIAKGNDKLISENSESPYFVFLKYNDLYINPSMDQIALDSFFDSAKMSNIDQEYLETVAESEEVNYEFLINALSAYMRDNVNYQQTIMDSLDSGVESQYLIYLDTKIKSITQTLPNNQLVKSPKKNNSQN